MKSQSTPLVFEAVIEKHGVGAYVEFPHDVEKLYGTRGQVKVHATFDGHPYRGVLAPMGSGRHVIGIRKDIAAAIGKTSGDVVSVSVRLDKDDRIVEIPPLLKTLLDKHKKERAFFESLSYTNRKEYALWISSAVKEETRDKRLALIIGKLSAGKKNPSEK